MIVRPDLANANMTEVSAYLFDAGLQSFIKFNEDGAMVIEAAESTTEQAIIDRLASFTPTTAKDGNFVFSLPVELRDHAVHIRDFGRMNQTQLDAVTAAQFKHVVRDLCRAMALLVDNRLN